MIATHDVGAIAYYSERRVVDTVGLIQPDAIAHLNRPDYIDFLNDFFAREHVTYAAFLDNWMHYGKMEIANSRTLWLADPNPRLLKVFEWVPGWTVMVPEGIPALNQNAIALMKSGRMQDALRLLSRSLQASPRDAATWYLSGAAMSASGEQARAEAAYRHALELYPDFENARSSLGLLLAQAGRRDEAIAVLEPLQQRNPGFPGLRSLWESLQAR